MRAPAAHSGGACAPAQGPSPRAAEYLWLRRPPAARGREPRPRRAAPHVLSAPHSRASVRPGWSSSLCPSPPVPSRPVPSHPYLPSVLPVGSAPRPGTSGPPQLAALPNLLARVSASCTHRNSPGPWERRKGYRGLSSAPLSLVESYGPSHFIAEIRTSQDGPE